MQDVDDGFEQHISTRALTPGKGGIQHVGSGRLDDKLSEEQNAKANEEREREEIVSSLRELTRYCEVHDAMRNTETVGGGSARSVP